MELNRLTYEVYFIDYADGKLSPEQVAELMIFLEEHKDLNAEFEAFNNLPLLSESMALPDKANLYKKIAPVGAITEENYDEYVVGSLEQDLDDNQRLEFEELLKINPWIKQEVDLINKTVLNADQTIVFEHKKVLKKSNVVSMFAKWSSVAAAIIVVGFLVSTLYTPDEPIPQFAVLKETVKQEVVNEVQIKEEPNSISVLNPLKPEQETDNKTKSVVLESTAAERDPITIHSIEPVANDAEKTQEVITEIKPDESKILEISQPAEENIEQQELPIIIPSQKEMNTPIKKTYRKPSKAVSVGTFLANAFRKKVLKEERTNKGIESVDVAHAGVLGLRKWFGSKLQVDKTYDDQGALVAYNVSNEHVSFTRNVHNK